MSHDDISGVLMGIDAIAAYADLPRSEVKALGKSRRLPTYRTKDGVVFSTKVDIDAWRARNASAGGKGRG